MNEGVIEQVGPPREIYRRPATLFVANFVGASNCVEGVVRAVRGGDRYEVELPAAGRACEVPGTPGLAKGDPAVVVVRPETMALAPPADSQVCLTGKVLDVAFLGSQVVTKVAVPGAGELTAAAPGDDPNALAADAEARLSFDPAAAWVVARDSRADAAAG
jgi:ABC-type Fe3+/spermidine/putrescine transport system ATPase subunit